MPFRFFFFVIVIVFAGLSAHSSKEAIINYYTFEAKGKASYGSLTLREGYKTIPINVPWFDWKCTATRQTDGINVLCNRGDDAVESKVYCALSANKQVRAVQIKKGAHFVSLEVLCKPEYEGEIKPKKKPSEPMVCMPASQAELLKQNQQQQLQQPDQQQSLPVEAPAPVPTEPVPPPSQGLPPPSSGALPAPEQMPLPPNAR
ncbi:MAG: hypothetical protein BroJett040_18330 [Oligoflexia bacterium]|nr:MAG: hypothetical protein BroJett040_18330 [Oligoflexia bacterium]